MAFELNIYMQMLKIEQLLVSYLAITAYVASLGNRDCQAK